MVNEKNTELIVVFIEFKDYDLMDVRCGFMLPEKNVNY
jgi:hypothetical protein